MFNEKLLQAALTSYKQNFHNHWINLNCALELVKCFKDNWDIYATDFADMLKRSFAKVNSSQLTSGSHFVNKLKIIRDLAQSVPEETRSMFTKLFDENKDLIERVNEFYMSANELQKKYITDSNKWHQQKEQAISTYLWLRYPDKYYIYQNRNISIVNSVLESSYDFKPKEYAKNIRNAYKFYDEICAELKKDTELVEMFKSHLTDTCYPDPELKTLTSDLAYYIAQHYIQQSKLEWLPKDYNPGLSVEDWIKLLNDKQIFDDSSLEIMRRFQDYGGAATCTQLSEKYGETWQFYSNKIWTLAQRIAQKTDCPIAKDNDGREQPWLIMFWTRKAKKDEAGSDVFKLRDELAEALRQIDFNGEVEGTEMAIDTKLETYSKEDFLREVYISEGKYDNLAGVLKNKKNIILQGAPGVGKTFAAKRLAYSLMGEKDNSRIEFVQFHQNYSYEDFVMGYKPVENGFELKHGIFYRFCKKAEADPNRDYYFIIDEINRGNMSKIFGELLMLIERDYRGTSLTLAYNGEEFSVPRNLYIIGMMNTADRSLAMIDYALRRRFSFFEMDPGFDSDGFMEYQHTLNDDTFNELVSKVKELNREITSDKSLGKGFVIGHSYFCGREECTEEWLRAIVEYDILPMLSEYWFDNSESLQRWENKLRGVFQ